MMRPNLVLKTLDGVKTQTRRIIKPQPTLSPDSGFAWKGGAYGIGINNHDQTIRNFLPACPYGKPGDQLWIRERFCLTEEKKGKPWVMYAADSEMRAPDGHFEGHLYQGPWKPSIHMFRWQSRLSVEIVKIWVEQVSEISEQDAIAEGTDLALWGDPPPDEDPREVGYPSAAAMTAAEASTYRRAFRRMWDSINGQRGFAWENTWVWVITYKVVKGTFA